MLRRSRDWTSVGPSSVTSPLKSPLCNKGKTMRDFEEELTALRKENFDLKMRVYVLNDQIELFQNIDNADQLYEVNANLKKEVEKLKFELADKEDLVLEASEAMNILSAKHRDDVSLLKTELEEKCSGLEEMNLRLQKEIERLMLERNEVSCSDPTLQMDDSNAFYAMAFASLPSGVSTAGKKLEVENLKLEEELADKLKLIDDNEKIIREQQDIIEAAKKQQQKLEAELKTKTDMLSGVHKDLREKEHVHLQMTKKAVELEEQLSLHQFEIHNLKGYLASNATPEKMRDLRNRYERCATENNILTRQITELESKLEVVESQKMALEASQDQANSMCYRCKNLEAQLEEERKHSTLCEEKLSIFNKERLSSVRSLQSLAKSNKALTMDIVTLNERVNACVCSNPKARQKEEEKVNSLLQKITELEKERDILSSKVAESADALQHHMDDKTNVIREYEQKLTKCCNDRIEDLESQLLKVQSEFEHLSSSESAKRAENEKLSNELETKNKEIGQLNEELRKRTFNLQELVNKELWSKNREIEKLNKSCEKKVNEIAELKERLTKQAHELGALTEKMQELSDQVRCSSSVSELQRRLDEECEKTAVLEKEVETWKKMTEESEKTRKELTNACCLFKARLEELATFLESLLPYLGSKKRKILQDAIDRSREASRTLSQTVINESNLTVPILPDFSQVDFFSDNDIDITAEVRKSRSEKQKADNDSKAKKEGADNLVLPMSWKINNYEDRFDFVKLANMSSNFNIEEVSEVSLPESLSDTASVPTRQSSLMKAEVEPQTKEENKRTALSESEGWSEPDRNVSMARIGLRVGSLSIGLQSSEESTEESGKVATCKRRCDAAEIRRLSLKVRSLERYIHNLKADQKSSTRSPFRDCSTVEVGEAREKLTSAVADLKKDKEKLEASLKNNKDVLNKLTASYGEEPTNRELLGAIGLITSQFEEIYGFFTEMEDNYDRIEEEKEAVTRTLVEKERKIESLNKEIVSLRAELKEKENEILEKQCALLETKNNYIVLDNRCKAMETTVEETNKWKAAVNKSKEEIEILKDTHLKELYNLQKKLGKALEERDSEVNELKSSLDRAFKRIDDVCLKKVLLETEFKQKVDSLQKEKRLEVEQEIIKRIDIERKLVEAYEIQAELRKRLDEEISKSKDVEMAQKDVRAELEQRVLKLEESNKDLMRDLQSLRGSQVLSDPESPLPFSRQRSNATSDYTSDPDQHEMKGSNGNLNHWFPVCGRNNNNCSPDLGIESDHGRLSSLDPPIGSPKTFGDVERENALLKRELSRKSKLLEDAQRNSKMVKEKLEDKIYCEIDKTHDLLEKTRMKFKKAQI